MIKRLGPLGTEEYRAWQIQPFPKGEAEEDLSEFASDLALLDYLAAEYLIPLVEHGVRTDEVAQTFNSIFGRL